MDTQLREPQSPAPSDGGQPPGAQTSDGRRKMLLREHLRELRNRIGKAMLGIFLATIVGWIIHPWLITHLTGPSCHIEGVQTIAKATKECPNGLMVMQGVMTPLIFTFKVSMAAGLVISSPVWSYQLWAFAAPGLHRHEKRYTVGFVLAAVPLFLAGAGLAYWVFPQALEILLGFTPDSFSNSIQGDQFLDFLLRMILVFGVSFVVPVFLVALNFAGVLSSATLKARWRAIIMTIFVFSALATPTGDPLTMVVLAFPLSVLFGLALGVIVWRERVRRRRGDGDSALSPDEAAPLEKAPAAAEATAPLEAVQRTGEQP
ncbi:twin-arginine translocase subunit TatC [Streptomyces polyrhachis]|uniref:Sec-independent protein translocase protein TatC n=1 Tax=Streptomyces polyrhachis TaxID=1282885 RepID=A0ABW2GM76_9ACTN